MSGGWVQRGALRVIPTDEAGYHRQADGRSDREHTLLFTLPSLSVVGLRPASDPQGGWLPRPLALATVYLAAFVHEALLL